MTYSDLPTRVDTPKSLFNPLKDNFVCYIRGDDNIKVKYTLPSMQISTFPTWMANVIEKKLSDEIKLVRYVKRKTAIFSEEEDKEILNEIRVPVNEV